MFIAVQITASLLLYMYTLTLCIHNEAVICTKLNY